MDRFTKPVRGKKAFEDPEIGWIIEKNRGNLHGGSDWKLKDKKGKRRGSLTKDGKILKVKVVAVSRHKSHKQSEQIRPFVLVIGDLAAKAEEILTAYELRWEIETYFRESKQDLSFESCHSTSEEHAIAWLTIQLCAHTQQFQPEIA